MLRAQRVHVRIGPGWLESVGGLTVEAFCEGNWDQLQKIEEILLIALSDWGVRRVEFVTAFGEPYVSSVWLGTSTDSERDELLDVPDLLGLVHDVLQPSGFELSLITEATAQSQETVDRDFEGKWFYALR